MTDGHPIYYGKLHILPVAGIMGTESDCAPSVIGIVGLNVSLAAISRPGTVSETLVGLPSSRYLCTSGNSTILSCRLAARRQAQQRALPQARSLLQTPQSPLPQRQARSQNLEVKEHRTVRPKSVRYYHEAHKVSAP